MEHRVLLFDGDAARDAAVGGILALTRRLGDDKSAPLIGQMLGYGSGLSGVAYVTREVARRVASRDACQTLQAGLT